MPTSPAHRVLAPAKLNLHLRVHPLGPDGFHPLLTWMIRLDWGDTLLISPMREPGVKFQSDNPAVPGDETNLVVRAARRILPDDRGVQIELQKVTPIGGGLGGGSSDAAAILQGVNDVLDLGLTMGELDDHATALGSDIPFFLHGPSSVCTGRGEIVRPIRQPRPQAALLILPPMSVGTPSVYRQFDAMPPPQPDPEPEWDAWCDLPALDLLPRLVNDLEPPAFALEPKLADLRTAAEAALRRPVRMSGSGSTLFTLYDTHEEAGRAMETWPAPTGVRLQTVSIDS